MQTGSWVQGAEPGTPDLIVGYKMANLFLLGYIEVKSQVGTLNDNQIRVLRRLHALNVPWLVARSMEDVDVWLKNQTYHGPEKLVKDVLSTENKFVSTERAKTKKSKLSNKTFSEHQIFVDKKLGVESQPIDLYMTGQLGKSLKDYWADKNDDIKMEDIPF